MTRFLPTQKPPVCYCAVCIHPHLDRLICIYVYVYIYVCVYCNVCMYVCESEILSDMYVFFVDTGMICSQPQRQKKMHSFGIGDCFLGGPAVMLEPKGRQ